MKRSKRKCLTKSLLRKAVWFILIVFGIFIAFEIITWPSVKSLRKNNPKTTAFIERYKKQQKKAGKKAYIYWKWVPYSRISPNLKIAVLVSEDINFFSHHGFDTYEIKNAITESVEKDKPLRGASTITQQVAKNLWLSPSRNPLRKLKEAILTIELEYFLSKKRILEIYLNVAEFGHGIYGAEAASRYYFKKSASELTDTESALLAASLPMPRYWHPGSKSRYYQKRVEVIIARMNKAQFLKRLI